MKIFNEPKKLAHFAAGFCLFGMALQFTHIMVPWIAMYTFALISGVTTLVVNRKTQGKDKLDLIGYMEVGLSFMPAVIGVVLVILFYVAKSQ